MSLNKRLEEAIIKRVLEVMEEGEVVTDSSGSPRLDENGKVMRATPSAAYTNVAMRLLEKMNTQSTPEDALANLVRDSADRENGTLPPIDMDGEDYTSR